MVKANRSSRNSIAVAVRNVVKHVPIPTAGVALGLAALGNLLQPFSPEVRILCGSLALALVLLVVAKIAMFPKMIKEDFRNSILASVSATLFMALMQLATYLEPIAHGPAFALWIAATASHMGLIGWFTLRYLTDFKLQEVFPTYFICYVGIVVGSVTSPVFGMQQLGYSLFLFGFVCYLVLLAVVSYRYVKHEIPEGAKPLFCIYTAPMSLSLVGYLATAADPNPIFIGTLLVLGQILLAVVLTQLPKFLKLDFYPSFAAMTFPFVITATALSKASAFFAANGMAFHPVANNLFIAETVLAVVMVAFVVVKYFGFFFGKAKEALDEIETEIVSLVEEPFQAASEGIRTIEDAFSAPINQAPAANNTRA